MLRNTVEEQSKLLSTLTTNDRNHQDLVADLTKAKEMLTMDKTYLQRELGEVTAAAHEQSRKVDSQQIHIEKLDAKILELTAQLVSVQMSTRTAFDERMEKEVNRLRMDYDKDMNSIKDTSKEISSHENRMLREIRQNLERDMDIMRQKLESKEAELNTLNKELTQMRSASESELSMLRAEIKMKHFEVTSLGATFEERSSQLKLAQLDLDVLREEVSVHKTALMRMEAEHISKCSRLEEDLSRAYETIHAYDVLFSDDSHDDNDRMLKEQFRPSRIESDVKNISKGLSTGTGSAEEGEYNDDDWERDDGEVEVNAEKSAVLDRSLHSEKHSRTISNNTRKHSLSVLVSNPRKFRHLLDSSERNMHTIDQLKQRIRELESTNTQHLKEKKKLKEEISKNIRELSLVPKSNKHVIDLYAQKDDECRLLHGKLVSYEGEVLEYKKTIEDYLKDNNTLRGQLRALMDERSELMELKAMLIEFQQQTLAEASQDQNEQHDGDEVVEAGTDMTADDVSMFVERLTSVHSFTEDQLQVIYNIS